MVFSLISWKQTFETITRELELAKKKKQSLDELLSKGRISQPTYEHLMGNLLENIREFESHKRSLTQNMNKRANELIRQTRFFEQLLASLEIQSIGRTISEEIYIQNQNTFDNGLDATKVELNLIKDSLRKISQQKPLASK